MSREVGLSMLNNVFSIICCESRAAKSTLRCQLGCKTYQDLMPHAFGAGKVSG